MTADHERNRRQFYASPRHTMEVDFDHYLWDLERERRRGAARAATSRMPSAPVPGSAAVAGSADDAQGSRS